MAGVAVVGSGLAGFTAYQTLRRGGLEPEEIAVFGTDDDPAAPLRRRAAAIRQREMRSESDGHCLPDVVPRARRALGACGAARRGRSSPRCSTATTRPSRSSSPTSSELRERSGWDRSLRRVRVERVRAVDGGFELDGHGVFRARAARARPSRA